MEKPFESMLKQAGGVLKEQKIYGQISQYASLGNIHPIGATYFTLTNSTKFHEVSKQVWALSNYTPEMYAFVMRCAYRQLKTDLTGMLLSHLVQKVNALYISIDITPKQQIDAKFIEACIATDDDFYISSNGWCSLVK
jgi:hypothetical protein